MAKIIVKNSQEPIPFDEVENGAIFMYENEYYMKITNPYDRPNKRSESAINLANGAEEMFVYEEDVFLVDAEITIL